MTRNVDTVGHKLIIEPDRLYESDFYEVLIRQSMEATEKEFGRMEPLVVLDLKGTSYTRHDTYFIATNRVPYVYKESQRMMMEALFNRYSFGYEVWNAWLQKKTGLTKTVMPYVNGNQVYLTIPYTETLYRRRKTWLNLSKCEEIWINDRPLTGPLPSSARKIMFCYPEFVVVYTSRIKLILQQLKIAKTLQEQWHTYYMDQMERLNYEWHIVYPESKSCLKHVQPSTHEGLLSLTSEDYRTFLSTSSVREIYEGMCNATNKRRHEELNDTPYQRENIKYLIQSRKDWGV